jgi:small subunit ribosomal protein S7
MSSLNNEYKDPIYKDPMISKLINILLINGKKAIIEEIVYKCLQILKKKKKQNPLVILKKAIENIEPTIILKSIKIAGVSYQIPFEINKSKQQNIAIKWLIESVNNRSEKTLINRLYLEILNAYNKKGSAYKKKDEIHHKAVSNRTYIHYRW